MVKHEPEIAKVLGLPVLPWQENPPLIEVNTATELALYVKAVENERLIVRMLAASGLDIKDAVIILDNSLEIVALAHRDECPLGQIPRVRAVASDFR